MAEENIVDYLGLDPRYVSLTSLNPFMNQNTASRSLMLMSHFSQSVVLLNGQEPIIQGGAERELGKATYMHKFDCTARILAVIPRYHHGYAESDVNFVSEVLIIYEDMDENIIRNMSIPYASSFHSYFGFQYEWNRDLLETLAKDVIVAKDTIVAKSPSLGENFAYKFGSNANVCMMTINGTTEDAIELSESYAKELSFKIFEKRTMDIHPEDILINLYGDSENYKPLPDHGEFIHKSGALAVKRRYDELGALSLLSVNDLQDFDPHLDEAMYVREGEGKIVDIKVIHTPIPKKDVFSNTDGFLSKYARAHERWRKDIIETYLTIEKDNKHRDIEFDPDTTRFIVESMAETNYKVYNKQYEFKRKMRNEDPGIYRIEYTIEYKLTPGTGYKLSDLSGGKSIICNIRPDNEMPIDKHGVRADVIVDPATLGRRMNIGRSTYNFIAKASRNLKSMIVGELRNIDGTLSPKDTLTNLDEATINILFNLILEFTALIDNSMHKGYSAIKDYEIKRTILMEIVEKEFYIYYKLGDREVAEMTRDIINSKFAPDVGPVTMKTVNGYEESVEDVMIAPLYVILLAKISDTWLATSSSKTNHFGLPVSTSKNDKHRLPWRNSPTRVLGETETRLFGSYGGVEFLAELKDMGGSIASHRSFYKNILNANRPGNMERAINRDTDPYGNDRALEILHSILSPAGMELAYIDNEDNAIDLVELIDDVLDDDDEKDESSINEKVDIKDIIEMSKSEQEEE